MALRDRLAPIRRWVPVAARKRLRDWGPYGYCGRYDEWAAAAAASIGYGSGVELDRTRRATAQVRARGAMFQQDGVAFSDMPDQAYRVALALVLAALERGGELTVLDFGGALAGAYYAFRPFLSSCRRLTWHVVEQPLYCEWGRREFADPGLTFFERVGAAIADRRPDVVLCSSVLQFLEQPFAVIDELLGAGAGYLIIDRTPFATSGVRELTVQRMPPTLYRASYPSWLFSEDELHQAIGNRYRVFLKWELPSAFTARARFLGFVFKARELEERL